ncbi:hypothetical protein [Actinotignum schaalii]|uniref:hypothetical protein n=2 Tax=Actinotignum TaxID=1653174 RepID=UPI0011DD563C|nr:hypothetical protein [Actinotignum schaalii]WQN45537.1 hypothetical protein U4A90_02235 [Actinotignum schaalii]
MATDITTILSPRTIRNILRFRTACMVVLAVLVAWLGAIGALYWNIVPGFYIDRTPTIPEDAHMIVNQVTAGEKIFTVYRDEGDVCVAAYGKAFDIPYTECVPTAEQIEPSDITVQWLGFNGEEVDPDSPEVAAVHFRIAAGGKIILEKTESYFEEAFHLLGKII